MSQTEQSQAASVSNTTFAREMWRHAEQGDTAAAKEVRGLWKYGQQSEGYGQSKGALTIHEIVAFAKEYLPEAGDNAVGFARAIERAALIKAYTLLPEIRQAEDAKHHRRYFRDGLIYGLAVYCGAIRALAMGQIPGETEAENVKPVAPRRASDLAKLEMAGNTETARPAFEVWAGRRQFDLTRKDGAYTNLVTSYVWMGWLAATLSAKPTELSANLDALSADLATSSEQKTR
jgi:hypothetical protein